MDDVPTSLDPGPSAEVVVNDTDNPSDTTPVSPDILTAPSEALEAQNLAAEAISAPARTAPVQQINADTPFDPYSLRGKAEEFEERALDTKPILGELVIQGQSTMFYAAPNTGKTLIVLSLVTIAIALDLIPANSVYYINADDSNQGMSTKLRILQDLGAHVLVPGFKGFKARDLMRLLKLAAETNTAQGTLIIIDTLKKFADPMDKKSSSEFAQACRQYVMAGGTILALGHTTKNPNADGTPRYSGTTDILDDFDSVYVLQAMSSTSAGTDRVVRFDRLKSRADSPAVAAYAYAAEDGITYQERLASVQPVDPAEIEHYRPVSEAVHDMTVMTALTTLIEAGEVQGQMAIAKAAAKACGASHRTALRVLNLHTGTTRYRHLWNYKKGDRGVRIYEMIDQT
jgi:hypothetical protein